MPSTIVAVASVLGGASCFATATILQCIGARRVPGARAISLRLLGGLALQRAFVGGLALDVVGVLLTLVALRSLPLFLVQAVSAASVGLTAILATWLLGERINDTERLSLGGIIVGISLLAVSAAPGEASRLGPAYEILLLAGIPALGLAASRIDRRRQTPAAAVGALSGLALGAGSIAGRGLHMPDSLMAAVAEPLVWAAALFTGLGLLLFSLGLQRGSATTVCVASMGVETLVPAAVGVLFLGDEARAGFGFLAVIGLATTLMASLSLTVSRDQRAPVLPTADS